MSGTSPKPAWIFHLENGRRPNRQTRQGLPPLISQALFVLVVIFVLALKGPKAENDNERENEPIRELFLRAMGSDPTSP